MRASPETISFVQLRDEDWDAVINIQPDRDIPPLPRGNEDHDAAGRLGRIIGITSVVVSPAIRGQRQLHRRQEPA
jgi:hypothetical protein